MRIDLEIDKRSDIHSPITYFEMCVVMKLNVAMSLQHVNLTLKVYSTSCQFHKKPKPVEAKTLMSVDIGKHVTLFYTEFCGLRSHLHKVLGNIQHYKLDISICGSFHYLAPPEFGHQY